MDARDWHLSKAVVILQRFGEDSLREPLDGCIQDAYLWKPFERRNCTNSAGLSV